MYMILLIILAFLFGCIIEHFILMEIVKSKKEVIEDLNEIIKDLEAVNNLLTKKIK